MTLIDQVMLEHVEIRILLTTYIESINAETAHEYEAKQMTPNVHGFVVKHEDRSKTCIAALIESIPGGL